MVTDTDPIVIQVALAGAPVPKGRPRVTRGGRHTYTPERTARAERDLRVLIGERYPGLSLDPLGRFGVWLGFWTTNGHSDVDNLSKLILDACNGLIWLDDSQVDYLSARVYRLPRQRARDRGTTVLVRRGC